MKKTIVLLLALISLQSLAQDYEYVYRNPKDSTYNSYLKIFPSTEEIRGLVIRDYTNLPDMRKSSPYQFTQLCSDAGLMVLICNSSKQFPELFIADSSMQVLESMVLEVIAAHGIPAENIFIGGISASGTRALRFAQYCERSHSTLKIRGAFAVDAPLDLARFYTSAERHKKYFKDGMLWEANYMLPLFDSLFKASPDEQPEAYRDASVFSHSDSIGGNAGYLKNTDLILFHEPDIDWWIAERGASYYDINSFDLAAFTVCIRSLGNENVELVSTSGKGFDAEGNRKPHSWTIVDEVYLVDWILKRIL